MIPFPAHFPLKDPISSPAHFGVPFSISHTGCRYSKTPKQNFTLFNKPRRHLAVTRLPIQLFAKPRCILLVFIEPYFLEPASQFVHSCSQKNPAPFLQFFPIPSPASMIESHPISHENPGNGLENGKFPAQGNHGTTLISEPTWRAQLL